MSQPYAGHGNPNDNDTEIALTAAERRAWTQMRAAKLQEVVAIEVMLGITKAERERDLDEMRRR